MRAQVDKALMNPGNLFKTDIFLAHATKKNLNPWCTSMDKELFFFSSGIVLLVKRAFCESGIRVEGNPLMPKSPDQQLCIMVYP